MSTSGGSLIQSFMAVIQACCISHADAVQFDSVPQQRVCAESAGSDLLQDAAHFVLQVVMDAYMASAWDGVPAEGCEH